MAAGVRVTVTLAEVFPAAIWTGFGEKAAVTCPPVPESVTLCPVETVLETWSVVVVGSPSKTGSGLAALLPAAGKAKDKRKTVTGIEGPGRLLDPLVIVVWTTTVPAGCEGAAANDILEVLPVGMVKVVPWTPPLVSVIPGGTAKVIVTSAGEVF